MYRRIFLLLTLTWICTLSARAIEPFLGTWKIDLTRFQTTAAPQFRPPSSLTYRIERAGEDGVKITEDWIENATKVSGHVTRTCKFDGRDYPVTGWGLPTTEAIRRLDLQTWEVTAKREGKVAWQTTWLCPATETL